MSLCVGQCGEGVWVDQKSGLVSLDSMFRLKCHKLGQLLGSVKWVLVDVWVVQWGKWMDNGLFLFYERETAFHQKGHYFWRTKSLCCQDPKLCNPLSLFGNPKTHHDRNKDQKLKTLEDDA